MTPYRTRTRRYITCLATTVMAVGLSVSCSRRSNDLAHAVSPARESTTAPTTTTTLSPEGILDRARNSLIRIRNTGCGELSIGSAWLSEDGTVITNRHVVEGANDIEMLTWDGVDLSPSGVAVAESLDVARLTGNWSAAPRLVAMPARTTRVEPGERIAIVGFPEGKELAVSTGIAVGYGPEPDTPEHEVLKLTTIIKHGNSGGPAIDVNGQVVGIAFAEETSTDEALVVPIQAVSALPSTAFASQPPCR